MPKHFMGWLLCCLSVIAWAQKPPQKWHLRLRATDKTTAFGQPYAPTTKIYSDTASLLAAVDSVHRSLFAQGYYAAAVDSLQWADSTTTAVFHIGAAYKWVHLANDNITETALSAIGFRPILYTASPFSVVALAQLKEKLMVWAENNGYPFCQVYLIDIHIDAPQTGDIAAKLHWQLGKRYTLDSLQISGKLRISHTYLAHYLGLQRGTVYDESRILKIRDRLRELPFLEETQTAVVAFGASRARPHLFLKRKRASQFDALVGFLPSSKAGGALLITGNATLGFQNLLGYGEQFKATWTQARAESPEATVYVNVPYLLGLPLGADADFQLYKRDTSYSEVRGTFGVQYHLIANDYVKVFWSTNSTTLLTTDTTTIRLTHRLPAILDVENNAFGVMYHAERLDYRFNPRKGFELTLRGSAGIKTIQPNALITNLKDPNQPAFDYATLYDTLSKRTTQYRAFAKADYYIPLGQRSVIRLGGNGGSVWGASPLYRNEQYRIGGARLLRGFDEESFYATIYGVATLEYRFLVGQNSYLSLFADRAYIADQSIAAHRYDRPTGIGAGITLETKAGILALSLAFGQQQQAAFDLNAAKVHFGYVSLF